MWPSKKTTIFLIKTDKDPSFETRSCFHSFLLRVAKTLLSLEAWFPFGKEISQMKVGFQVLWSCFLFLFFFSLADNSCLFLGEKVRKVSLNFFLSFFKLPYKLKILFFRFEVPADAMVLKSLVKRFIKFRVFYFFYILFNF